MAWPLFGTSFASSLRLPRGSLQRMAAKRDCIKCSGSKSIAVIGAGAAGLVAARELRKENHQVTVFEQSDRCGGVWVYTDKTEQEDPTGQRKDQARVHSSMYKSLRTNLPRHIMAYTDVPFILNATESDDTRLYCSHQEVLRYLEQFNDQFQISRLTRYNTLVTSVSPKGRSDPNGVAHQGPQWEVTSRNLGDSLETTEAYEAVVVCNGHYSDPRVPNIPGSNAFPGKQMHTHNFRTNGQFRGQQVVIMGASASGQDVARGIAEVADKVYFSARPMKFGSKVIDWESSNEPFGANRNMMRRAPISRLEANGTVHFQDGWTASNVDSIVYATGYHYTFPFLDSAGVVQVKDNRIDPLYQHAICITHPTLSFIGIPWQVIPFPMMELQAKWIARLLSGKSQLPSRAAMQQHTDHFSEEREKHGVPTRYFHRLGEDQWAYNAWLQDQISASEPRLPEWRPKMHDAGRKNIAQRPEAYRDTFPDKQLVALAEAEGRALMEALYKSQPVC